jgi:hypothetical protein
LNQALELINAEAVFAVFLQGVKLGRHRRDKVKSALIHGEVHESDAELRLDLGL